MKLKLTLCWIFLFIVLAAFLEWARAYHFFFCGTVPVVPVNAGLSGRESIVAGRIGFVVIRMAGSIFAVPLAGPAIVAGLLTATGIFTRAILKRIAPGIVCPACYLLPGVFLLFLHFNFNYLAQGTVAYILMLIALWGTCVIEHEGIRLITGLVVTPVLFWLAGPVALLYAVCWSMYELLNRTPRGWLSLLACVEVVCIGIAFFYRGFVGNYCLAFLPDSYYQPGIDPKSVLYFAWLCLPLLCCGALLLRKRQFPSGRIQPVGSGLLQVAVLAVLLYTGYHRYGDGRSYNLKTIDYYARREQWDKVIEYAGKLEDNYLYLCYLNVALAARGELAERMFHYNQANVSGLAVAWNKSVHVSMLLSNIAFVMGYTTTAQNMAFEAYVSALGEGNPRMLKRLV